jgi:2-polyprenyl-6-methoxyphenol hydroxylase-like FAD-dependent oxidoreductase
MFEVLTTLGSILPPPYTIMLPARTFVLIVGADPAGLAAAISLFHHGCKDIIIVDAVERTATSSRAMAIHAAIFAV